MDLTDALKQYAQKKIEALERFVPEHERTEIVVWVEMGKTTDHHAKGKIFSCEIHFDTPRHNWIAHDTTEDLYAAIDRAADKIKRQLAD